MDAPLTPTPVVGQFVIRLPTGPVTLKMTEQEMRDYVSGKCRIVDGKVVYVYRSGDEILLIGGGGGGGIAPDPKTGYPVTGLRGRKKGAQ